MIIAGGLPTLMYAKLPRHNHCLCKSELFNDPALEMFHWQKILQRERPNNGFFLVFKVVLHAVVVISEVLRLSTKSRCSRCCRHISILHMKMAAHPLMVLRVRGFVEALMQWAESPRVISVDGPFIFAGCIDRLVIFDLRFRMEVPKGDPILATDPIIGRIMLPKGVKHAITLGQRDWRRDGRTK